MGVVLRQTKECKDSQVSREAKREGVEHAFSSRGFRGTVALLALESDFWPPEM